MLLALSQLIIKKAERNIGSKKNDFFMISVFKIMCLAIFLYKGRDRYPANHGFSTNDRINSMNGDIDANSEVRSALCVVRTTFSFTSIC